MDLKLVQKLKVKLLNDKAVVPSYATNGAACFDISATNDGFVQTGSSAVFGTGLSFEIPKGYVMMIYSRSGHAFKNSVKLSNSVGVIDSDYRGEVKVKLQNDGTENLEIKVGDRIAQAMLQKVNQVMFDVVDELSETARGEGGFGSTGTAGASVYFDQQTVKKGFEVASAALKRKGLNYTTNEIFHLLINQEAILELEKTVPDSTEKTNLTLFLDSFRIPNGNNMLDMKRLKEVFATSDLMR